MAAEQLAAMTGMPAAEAAQYIEMAGGSLEAAVSLYFDMAGGYSGGGPGAGSGGGVEEGTAQPTLSPAHTLVFGSEPVPVSWSQQGLEFSPEPSSTCCLLQHKNGPCGVLAAINAEIVALAGCPEPSAPVDDAALAGAISAVLMRCAAGGAAASCVVIASWADGTNGGELLETEVEASGAVVSAQILQKIAAFRGPGGVNLLCYSAVLTRGLDLVRADMALDGGSPPLVSGPYALCSTELLGLLMAGTARGNVSAYEMIATKVAWRTRGNVGLLSHDELEMGRPLADELKGPMKPVYVLHGGDHFTLLWAPSAGTVATGDWVDFVHWNGLPPNRALVRLRLHHCSLSPPPPAPLRHVPTHWRPKVGEVESVVQALSADKQARPGCWRTFSYELALVTQAVVDEDASEERPAHVAAPPRFEQGKRPDEGQAWRCASCYQTRFKTMCFGENAAPATRMCKFCGKSQEEVGWTLWKSYQDLSPAMQRRIDRTHGPKILSVLRTRWPEVEISLIDEAGKYVALGGKGDAPSQIVTPCT